MAEGGTILNVKEAYCGICKQVLNLPRSLPCEHNFCHDCLISHMARYVNKTFYFCPTCVTRYQTESMIAPGVVTWVKQTFPVNLKMDLMSDILENMDKSDKKSNKFTNQSSKLNVTVTNKRHWDPKMDMLFSKSQPFVQDIDTSSKIKHDSVYSKDEAKTVSEINKSLQSYNSGTNCTTSASEKHQEHLPLTRKDERVLNELISCPFHKSLQLKYFCKTHKAIVCEKCCKQEHAKCSDVQELGKIVEEKSDKLTQIIEERKGNLTQIENTARLTTTQACEYLRQIRASEEEIMNQLDAYEKKLIQTFAMVRMSILENMCKQSDTLKTAINNSLNECNKTVALNDQMNAQLEAAVRSGNPMHILLAGRGSKGLRERCSKPQENMKQLKCIEATEFSQIQSLLLGSLRLKLENVDMSTSSNKGDGNDSAKARKPNRNKSLKLIQQVQLSNEKYQGTLHARSCVWLGEYVLIAVEGPNMLYFVNADTQSIQSTYSCPSTPYSVRVVNDHQLWVFLAHVNELLLVHTNRGQVNLTQTFKFSEGVTDIIYSDKHQTWISLLPLKGTINFCDTKGYLKFEAKLNETGAQTDMFNAHFMMLDQTEDFLYASSFERHKVTRLNMQGKKTFEYKHINLRYPYGLAVDNKGYLYVTNSGRRPENASIHVLDKFGCLVRELLIGILELPWSISFNSNMDKMAITDKFASGQLKLYKFT